MTSNDTWHLERVEQQLEFLSSTQPTPGRCCSIRPVDLQLAQDEPGQREPEGER